MRHVHDATLLRLCAEFFTSSAFERAKEVGDDGTAAVVAIVDMAEQPRPPR